MSSDSAAVAGGMKSLGAWSVVCGVLALVGVLMIGQASWEWIPGVDPAGWLRIATAWMLPAGALAAMVLGALSVARRSGRTLGITGIALAIISIGVFIAMLVTHPY